jgi:hypothetical protein
MMVPGSRDCGSVKMKLSHENQHFDVKVYPRLDHVIRSFNAKLQSTVSKTLPRVATQLQGAITMVRHLSGCQMGIWEDSEWRLVAKQRHWKRRLLV